MTEKQVLALHNTQVRASTTKQMSQEQLKELIEVQKLELDAQRGTNPETAKKARKAYEEKWGGKTPEAAAGVAQEGSVPAEKKN